MVSLFGEETVESEDSGDGYGGLRLIGLLGKTATVE
jgi:hypothetical protein